MGDADEFMNITQESIYGDSFRERVPGKVWELKLELSVMRQYLRKEEKPQRDRNGVQCRRITENSVYFALKSSNDRYCTDIT